MFYPVQVYIVSVHRPLSGNTLRFIEKLTFKENELECSREGVGRGLGMIEI